MYPVSKIGKILVPTSGFMDAARMKTSRLFVCLFFAAGLFLGGCANQEALPSGLAAVVPAASGTPAARAVALTIYRPGRLMGFGLRPTVRMNGVDLVTVPNGTAFHTQIAPGRYVFDVDGHKTGADLDAKPGESYYFQVSLEPGVFAGNGVLNLVAPQQGAFESKVLKPVPRDDIDATAFR